MIGDDQTRVVIQNVANLYARPDTDSEMTTQVVLGARVVVEETQNGFCRVAMEDRYQGWISELLLAAPQDDSDLLTITVATLFAEIFTSPNAQSEMLTKLVVGSSVVLALQASFGDWVPLLLPKSAIGYIHSACLNSTYAPHSPMEAISKVPRADLVTALGHQIAQTAKRFMGTPYLWGGCTPFGLDCSGLTQIAYKLNGVQLLRDAQLQFADKRFMRVEEGQSLETALLEDGDLVAFSRREDKRPTHIGIALGDGRFIQARGGQGVRIDFCDTAEYGETYLGAIRLSADADFAVEAA